MDDGEGGGTPGNLIQDNEAEATLRRVIMPLGVTLDSTTFTNDRAGYNARGFPVLGAGGGGKVELRTDPPGRTYRVIMQHTSGGLSLDGPL